ncbi:perlucin-like protein [Actinia tenebrosa]|uniref:Perlucin-like protein n=1 Tax=Actinia tenebrosa TaxID=6105 RepID=A0A6P8IVK3_ACTTE|nr:perlucin-like protein [Actinia tenebrosa]
MFRLSVLFVLVVLCMTVEGKYVDLGSNQCSFTALTRKISSLEKKLDNLLLLCKCSDFCPAGWTTYASSTSCYRFVNSAVTKWKDARKACLAMGSDLVKIESLRENIYVFNLARSYAYKSVYMWIGLHKDVNKNFVWVDGSTMSGQYTRWHSGKPNNGDAQEDCVHLYLANGGYWNDIRCNYPNKGVYMCEKSKQISG